MINREEILRDLDEARDGLLAFEKIGFNNIENKILLDNYKKQFALFRFNIVRMSDNLTLSNETEIKIENFMENVRIMTNKITYIIQQNK